MPSRKQKDSFELGDLHDLIFPIFTQAQLSLANHRKNVVSLHKIHKDAIEVTETLPKGKGIQLTGEAAFNKVFADMLNRILSLKKGVTPADKVVKFVAQFVRYTSEKAAEEKEKAGEEPDEDEDTPASRFVGYLVKHLMRGFQARDKNVRYRVVQCVAEMISSIGEIDEDLFTTLRATVLERVSDKETHVRVQAVVALSKLQEGEDPNDIEEGEQSLTEVLADILQYDPAPEVRRAALLNITASKVTLEAILSRTRDEDTLLRKILYSHVLTALPHPKLLSISQREEVVKNGLKDREPSVRAAAGRLVGSWVDLLGAGLEELLKMFDLILSEEVAQEALFSVFVTRPDLFDAVEFGDEFWAALNPERAFLARAFVDHCIEIKDNERLERSLPVVTALAFKIQDEYNKLTALLGQPIDEDEGQEEREEREDRKANKELVIAQLLKMAVNLDYADEIGRRKMDSLVRAMILQEDLPEGLVSRCLDVLRKLSASERDLIRLVVEVVQELRDLTRVEEPEPERAPEDETQFGDDRTEVGKNPPGAPEREMSPETQARAEAIDLRCLALCIGMLERVNSNLQDNSVFHGLLPELIVPSVRSKDPLLRERGLTCLGLCCTIDKRVALSSFPLFVQQLMVATDELKKKVMETVFDLLMIYESEFFKPEHHTEELLLRMLGQEAPEVQAIACEGIAKLMLSGIVKDDQLLQSLVLLYVIPDTETNLALRQCLSYFFPVFCYSSPSNQERMQKIFLKTYKTLGEHREELEEDQQMIPPTQIALLFVDWTDPLKVVEIRGVTRDEAVQAEFASDIVKALLTNNELTKEDMKVFCQLLPKLYIPENLDEIQARELKILTSTLQKRKPLKDSVSKNAFAKFDKSLDKRLAKQLEDFDHAHYRELESLKKLFAWLDEMMSDEEEEQAPDDNMPPDHKARRVSARARSKKSDASQDESEAGGKTTEEQEIDQAIDDILDSGKESGGEDAYEDAEAGEVESQLGLDDDEETE